MSDSKDEKQELQPQPPQFSREQIDLLKRTVAKGTTDDEFKLFAYVCARTGLDPFLRQIHAVKRWDAESGREKMTIQTGIDGLRLQGERTRRYAPGREPVFGYAEDGSLHHATAFVKKLTADGTWHEIGATALLEEYAQRTKTGALNSFWKRMPHGQLAKCAEALALRKAFPQETAGLLTNEEMAQADVEDRPPFPHPVEPPKVIEPKAVEGAAVDFRGGRYPTAGIRQELFDKVQVACKRVGKDVAVNLLGPLGIESVLELTEETGREYLAALELAADNVTDLPLGSVER